MNTPAHAVLNLLVLAPRASSARTQQPGSQAKAGSQALTSGAAMRAPAKRWILAGALVPDLPMVVFYAVERGWLGKPESQLWTVEYFRESWQLFIDAFNSIPLALIGLWAARVGRHQALSLFFASVLLHCLTDLPVHHDDGHRHFLPLSSFRFQSPISYWNPNYYGSYVAAFETLIVVAGAVFFWKESRWVQRCVWLGLASFYLAGYLRFYLL